MSRGGLRAGAGRPGWRPKAEGSLRIDVRELKRRNLLGVCSFQWRWSITQTGEEVASISIDSSNDGMRLAYAVNGTPRDQDIDFDRTRCYFGGQRTWLRCPLCGRRCGVVYFSGQSFVCRSCAHVTYSSQSEDALSRSLRQQQKLESRLRPGWLRPPRMHLKTYERLLDRLARSEEVAEEMLCGQLLRLGLVKL